MSELNREQIIKDLKWCSSGGNCINCPENDENPRLSKEGCMALQMRYALSLITSQAQEIATLHASCTELERKRASLNDENERLRDVCKPPIARNIDIIKATTKSDTVRNMRKSLYEEFLKIARCQVADEPNMLSREVFAILDKTVNELLKEDAK